MSVSEILSTNTINDVVSNYGKIVGKLTLFDESSPKLQKASLKLLDRPVTPLENEVNSSPVSLDELLSLFRRRITISKSACIPEEDQLNLLGIVEKEICIAWPQLAALLDYPFFDEEQNKEMRRSLFITVIRNCKESFEEFREKVLYYNKKDIFSTEANMVRVRLQLAEDVKIKLHIPKLRRHMYQNIAQGIRIENPECCHDPSIDKLENKFQTEVRDINRRPTTEDQSKLRPLFAQKEKEKENVILTKEKDDETVLPPENPLLTISDMITSTESSVDRRPSNDADLHRLFTGTKEDLQDQDSFPQLAKTMSSIKYYQNKNEELKNKIEVILEKNKLMKENETFVPRKPLVVQPSSIPRSYNQTVYLVGDIRPTPRRNDCDISLATNGPLWNELADEITPDIVKRLDSNLFRGEEVKDIYKEMMKTVSHDHLTYTQDTLFEECPSKINVQEILSSSTLSNEHIKERIINSNLKVLSGAPWETEKKTRAEWEHPVYNMPGSSSDMDLRHFVEMSRENFNQQKYLTGSSYGGSLASALNSSRDPKTLSLDNFSDQTASNRETPFRVVVKRDYVVNSERFSKGLSQLPRLMQDRLVKQYNEWINCWKNNFSIDDYSKFLSLQPTDFLSVIFHHFDSKNDDEDEMNDQYVPSKILEQRHKMKEREMERNTIVQAKLQELERQKNFYAPGLWNPSSIFIGGLGKIPVISDKDIFEILRDKPQLEDPDEVIRQKSAYSRAHSAVSNSKPVPLFTKKKQTKDQSTAEKNMEEKISIIQSRLEKIWLNLKMPSHKRLDMTIKYASGEALKYIDTILNQWEATTSIVVDREQALSELEKFERIASDPNRFFVKGYRGSSMARLEESKIRTNLHSVLDEITVKAQNAIEDLKSICGDDLTFAGRLYSDKIKWDRTEMLYWLQEERKELCIKSLHLGVSME